MRYARFPQISVKLNITPIGTMARLKSPPSALEPQAAFSVYSSTHMYVRVVIGTLWRESSVLVKRAMYWVMMVPKTWCHVVRKSAAVGVQRQCSYVPYLVIVKEPIKLTEVY